jgi:hypothetical protein
MKLIYYHVSTNFESVYMKVVSFPPYNNFELANIIEKPTNQTPATE